MIGKADVDKLQLLACVFFDVGRRFRAYRFYIGKNIHVVRLAAWTHYKLERRLVFKNMRRQSTQFADELLACLEQNGSFFN